jgi:branched-chain amino acid transport system ATP-binding protein
MIEIRNLRAGYGSINILWDLSLAIGEGELTCIVGPNGAGKTTLLRAIMGLIPITQGEIQFNGTSLANTKTWEMAKQGVVLIPEGRLIFRDMTVEENLIMGAFPKEKRPRTRANLDRVYALFPRLLERRTQMAGSLSGGESQMLAMGRGLMAEPKLILLDEPSLGLAPVIVQEIFAILSRLKGEGTTLVLVEQNTHMAVSVADHIHLMQTGTVVFSQPASQVNLDQLHNLYFAR